MFGVGVQGSASNDPFTCEVAIYLSEHEEVGEVARLRRDVGWATGPAFYLPPRKQYFRYRREGKLDWAAEACDSPLTDR